MQYIKAFGHIYILNGVGHMEYCLGGNIKELGPDWGALDMFFKNWVILLLLLPIKVRTIQVLVDNKIT